MTTPPRITIEPPEPEKPRTVGDMDYLDVVTIQGNICLIAYKDNSPHRGGGEAITICKTAIGTYPGETRIDAHHGKLRIERPALASTDATDPEKNAVIEAAARVSVAYCLWEYGNDSIEKDLADALAHLDAKENRQ